MQDLHEHSRWEDDGGAVPEDLDPALEKLPIEGRRGRRFFHPKPPRIPDQLPHDEARRRRRKR